MAGELPSRAPRGGEWLRLNRRGVLAGGTILSLAAAWPALAASAASTERAIRYVVFDSRYRESNQFAEHPAFGGAERLDVAAGLTRLWQDRLVPHWREGAGVVTGLTTRSVWDGLSQQAMHQFRRPAKIALHSLDPETGLAAHRICAAARDITDCAATDWPARMALAAKACADLPGRAPSPMPTGSTGFRGDCLHLATWMIG